MKDRWLESLGPVPSCLGSYVPADEQCDGVPCRWRHACDAWTRRCAVLGVDPEQEKRLLGGDVVPLLPLIRALLTKVPREYEDRRLHRIAWRRFLDAMTGELPPERILALSWDLAAPGDLFLSARSMGRERRIVRDGVPVAAMPRFWAISIKTGPEWEAQSLPLVRFHPKPWTVVEPSVQLRTDLHALLARWPEAERTCRRLRGDAHRQRFQRIDMPTLLVRVLPDRIEDVGRLAGVLVRERFYDVPSHVWRL